MKLCAYLINGTPVNQLTGWDDSDLNANELYQIIEDGATVPTDYQDISSVIEWYKHGIGLGKDYKYVRKEAKSIYTTNGWNTFDTQSKQILAKFNICTQAENEEIYPNFDTRVRHSIDFHLASKDSRQNRLLWASMILFNRLGLADVFAVNGETAAMQGAYVNAGMEGTLEGDPEGLFDWLQARAGTVFETTGLPTKTYAVNGLNDCSELADELWEVFSNGNYG